MLKTVPLGPGSHLKGSRENAKTRNKVAGGVHGELPRSALHVLAPHCHEWKSCCRVSVSTSSSCASFSQLRGLATIRCHDSFRFLFAVVPFCHHMRAHLCSNHTHYQSVGKHEPWQHFCPMATIAIAVFVASGKSIRGSMSGQWQTAAVSTCGQWQQRIRGSISSQGQQEPWHWY